MTNDKGVNMIAFRRDPALKRVMMVFKNGVKVAVIRPVSSVVWGDWVLETTRGRKDFHQTYSEARSDALKL